MKGSYRIPDFLIRQAEEVARREGTTVDSIISIALSSQVFAWKVRDTFEQRAARGKAEDLAEILVWPAQQITSYEESPLIDH